MPITISHATTAADCAAAAELFSTVMETEFGYGLHPQFHQDLLPPYTAYLETPQQRLFLAHDAAGALVGIAALRRGGPKAPPHPAWLAHRYAKDTTLELTRVCVDRSRRTDGIGKALVVAAKEYAAEQGFAAINFHTNTKHPAAEAFWRAVGAVEVFDARGTDYDDDPAFETLHFEFPLVAAISSSSDPVSFVDHYQRWEEQQSSFVSEREQGYALMFEVIDRLIARPKRLLDLGAGPGCLSIRAKQYWPEVEVTAIELDPMLVRLGKEVHGDQIQWLEKDLRDPAWLDGLPAQSFDAICSSTALHYLRQDRLPNLTQNIAKLLRPGGVFADLDTLILNGPRLAQIGQQMRKLFWTDQFSDGRQTWDEWWQQLRTEPGFEQLWQEREARFGPREAGDMPSLAAMTEALQSAGFSEYDTVSQFQDKRLLIALR